MLLFCQKSIVFMTFLSCFLFPLYDIIVLVIFMIKEYRKLRGFTQEELAEKINISWRQLQRIEKNEQDTSVKTLKRIVQVLKIPDKDIINYLKG